MAVSPLSAWPGDPMPASAGTPAFWRERWQLEPDGEAFSTRTSVLWPVRHKGRPAMLKLARVAEEEAGAALMAWWNGDGAAQVLALEGPALLMERAVGGRSLLRMAQDSDDGDDAAMNVLVQAARHLHAPRAHPAPALVPLETWFGALFTAARHHGDVYSPAARMAHILIDEGRDVVPLHGDIQHGNVLDSGSRGWLAIDPKGLTGPRGFDYANMFCNPAPEIAARPDRLHRRLGLVSVRSGLSETELAGWLLAWSGLSAAFCLEDGDSPAAALAMARLALARLAQDGLQPE